jgi:hypothetical protein
MTAIVSVHTTQTPSAQSGWTLHPLPDASNTGERTSSVIARLARETQGDDIALADIVDALKDRSFGAMLILFAMPNTVIPGVIFIVGGPIILIAFQLALGYRKPWLPDFMLKRRFRRSTFKAITAHVGRFLVWLERWLRPRAAWLTSRPVERLLGLYIVGLAVLLATPLPLGATLPALGISLIAAGLIEKDGAAVALGLVVGFAGTLYAAAFASGVAFAALSLVTP